MTRRRVHVRFMRLGTRARRGCAGQAVSVVARAATIAVVVAGGAQFAGPAAADDGPSEATVVEAAAGYTSNSPESAAALVEAASPTDSIPITDQGAVAVADGAGGTQVAVGESGQATLSAPGMPTVGIAVDGASDSTGVVSDGAVVNPDALPSTDVVTRATDLGGQVVAVLQSAAASDSIPFALNLPNGSQLVSRADGSVEVKAPVESEVVPQAELDRVAAQVDAALGDTSSDEPLTDAEREAVEAVVPAQTQIVTEVETIATVAPAWAVDANGTNLETHYEVDGNTITQVVETNTAYPVTADPNWLWWAWTSATCVSDVAALLLAHSSYWQARSRRSRST